MAIFEIELEDGSVFEIETEDTQGIDSGLQRPAPDPVRPNVALETAKGTFGTLGKSAGGLAESLTTPIRHPIETAKGIGRLGKGVFHKFTPGVQPEEQLVNEIGKFYKERYGGVEEIAETVAEDPFGFLFDVAAVGGVAGGALKKAGRLSKIGTLEKAGTAPIFAEKGLQTLKAAQKGVSVAKKGFEFAGKKTGATAAFDKLAGTINNSLIKPAEKAFRFGNPGRGVAKEGLTANTLAGLGKGVSTRLKELTERLDLEIALGKNIAKKINLDKSLEPLTKMMEKFQKAPASNKAFITKLDDVISDITGVSTGEVRKLKSLTPREAVDFKRYVGGLQDWEAVGSRNRDINIALRRVYGNIDNAIDAAIPATKEINQRITDLISADKAITHRLAVQQRQNLLKFGTKITATGAGAIGGATVGNVPGALIGAGLGAGVEALGGSTAVKSRVASGLARQFGKFK